MESWLRQKAIDNGAKYKDYYGLYEPTVLQYKTWSKLSPKAAPIPFTFFGLFERYIVNNKAR